VIWTQLEKNWEFSFQNCWDINFLNFESFFNKT